MGNVAIVLFVPSSLSVVVWRS